MTRLTRQEIINNPDFTEINDYISKLPKKLANEFYNDLQKMDVSREGFLNLLVELGSHTPDGELTEHYRTPIEHCG